MARVDSKKAKAGTEENIEYLENWLVELQELLPLEAQRDKLKKEVIPGLKKEIIESDKLVTPLSEAVEMVRPCPFSAGYGGELIVDIVFFLGGRTGLGCCERCEERIERYRIDEGARFDSASVA